jgi:magnesium transporter
MAGDDLKKPQHEISAPEGEPDFESLHAPDASDHLENLPVHEQLRLILSVSEEDAADIIAEMEERERVLLMSVMQPDKAADILEAMSPDDAADVLDELSEEHSRKLLKRVEAEEALALRTLMRFDPDTAGGVMNTEVSVLDADLTADEAISRIRHAAEDAEIPYYGYITEADDTLIGVISLRDLMLARPGTKVRELIKNQTLISAVFDVDQEEVAHQLRHYSFLALPIVDYDNKLLGVVTHDDVIDILHEEAGEDMLGMMGAGQDESIDTPWLRSVGMRIPWLMVNIANSALAAWVVHKYEGTIAQMAVLAAIMPLVANLAGNTGHQSLAVMIRQMGFENLDRAKAWTALYREFKIGALNGLIVSIVALIGIYLFTWNPELSAVAAIALGLDMTIGNVAGAAVPLILRSLGRDPAQASSIFVTFITDIMGFFIFLSLATMFLL